MNAPRHEDFRDRTYPVEEDIQFQRNVWRFERVGWYALLLIIVLALAGLFSKGPLSSKHAVSADGSLSADYQLFSRTGAQDNMVIEARGKPGQPIILELDGRLLEGASIQTMQPLPIESATRGHALRWQLKPDEQGLALLYLTLQNDGVGLYRSQLKMPDGQSVEITRFIYP